MKWLRRLFKRKAADEQAEYSDHIFTVTANFGDLVAVDGYPDRIFYVDGYRAETHHYPDITWLEFVYELTDAHSFEFLEADDIDIIPIAEAEYADEVLAEYFPERGAFEFRFGDYDYGREAVGMAGKERKLTAREMSAKEAEERKQARKERAEAMDNELDRYNFFKRMYENTGERSYKESMDSVMDGIKSKAKEGE